MGAYYIPDIVLVNCIGITFNHLVRNPIDDHFFSFLNTSSTSSFVFPKMCYTRYYVSLRYFNIK